MTIVLGYARVSEWELRLVDRSRSHIGRPLTLSQQEDRLRRACEAMGIELHDEICTDQAPGGLDTSWGLATSDGIARPGQARLRELLGDQGEPAVIVVSLDRLSAVVREIEWLLRRPAGVPAIVALSEGVSTLDARDLARAAEFLDRAAAERRARRASVPVEKRPGRDSIRRSREFDEGVWWEHAAPRTRSRDSLEARRLAGLPHCRPSLSSDAVLARRVRSMRDGGMTLQAIADTLNSERVPTVRGGARWRRSALQNLVSPAKHEETTWFQ